MSGRKLCFGLCLFAGWAAWSSVAQACDRGIGATDCGRSVGIDGDYREFDSAKGMDPRVYPRDLPVDFKHLKLDLLFEDLKARKFSGVATITFRPVRSNLKSLRLDAADLAIEKVVDGGGNEVPFEHDGRHLAMLFGGELAVDQEVTVSIHYRCAEPVTGMHFALPGGAYADRPPVVHTQGETEFARYWYPCFDSPGLRLTTEMVVTVPRPFFALSNGKLIEVIDDNRTRRTTYHWRQSVPHVFYLVTLVIGEFDVAGAKWRDIPLSYHVPMGRAEDARRTYVRTPDMLEFFSTVTGVDYPYEKYDQVNVPLFDFGGMEHTTATTMGDRFLLDERAALDTDYDGLISHELAHQWYGDLITCRSWPHIWLNEGFATFFDTLWREKQFGREEYLDEIRRNYRSIADHDRTDTPGPLVLRDYTDELQPFWHKDSLAYTKGACVLHMLRHQLGDETFFKVIQAYTRRFRESEVETDDFRRVIEEVSGRNFEQFFEQWTYRPGIPHLNVTYTWDPDEKTVTVDVEQLQSISAATPAFRFPLDVQFRTGQEVTSATIDVSSRTASWTGPFGQPPEMFSVDPQAGVLARVQTNKPRPMWLRELRGGPTSYSRIVAAEALANESRPEVIDALTRSALEADEHWTVRAAAARALGVMQSERALESLAVMLKQGGRLDDHKTRRAVVEAIGQYRDQRAVDALRPLAESDSSYNVEAAATEALGKMHGFDVLPTLLANADKPSHAEVIRTAALKALGELGAAEGVAVAKRYASRGNHERLRPEAVKALGRLARLDEHEEAIQQFLIDLLNDDQHWTVEAAVDALIGLGDDEGVAAVRALLKRANDPRIQRAAEAALRRFEDAAMERRGDDVLRRELDAVRTRVRELETRLETLQRMHSGDGG
ncbi:MAG: hypothetical protein HOP29_12010 [Phycisphaerales bacterium]|nr:hypothetical protein [Phycisphaerales bacterium]